MGPSDPKTGFAQRDFFRKRSAVGAVYDRAVFATEWDKRAVIDRAYNKKWSLYFPLGTKLKTRILSW